MKTNRNEPGGRAFGRAVAVIATVLLVVAGFAEPVDAFEQKCGTVDRGHCYSIMKYSSPSRAYGGMIALINQAPMDAGYSKPYPDDWFITAEMWFIQGDFPSASYVENGFINGYIPTYGTGAYAIFNAHFDSAGNQHVNYPATMGPANDAGHKFQTSRGGSASTWIAQFDDHVMNTYSANMASGTYAQLGGETAIRNPAPSGYPVPHAATFNQNGILLTIPNVAVPMGGTGTMIHAGMNGVSYYTGEWSWNAP